jgi:hypothetical protein
MDASKDEEEEADEGVSKERETQLKTKQVSFEENFLCLDFAFRSLTT